MATYAAPAKVNLSLRILGKRDDGFHEVDLLMARIDLEDQIDIDKARSLSFDCDEPGVPTDDSNLVIKAVREFENSYGRAVKKKITLHKNIPHGAGLGGGSSDAATTLLALNAELGTQFDLAELSAMAARIGSDVPFFLNPVLSRCTGRGEIVTPVTKHTKWRSPIVLIKPSFGVATAEAYSGIHYARRMKGLPYGTQKVDGIELVNDLERPVFAKFPFLGLIKSWLLRQNGVRAAMMSGSGSTIFALTHTLEQARNIAEAAKAELDPTLYTYCGTANAPMADNNLYSALLPQDEQEQPVFEEPRVAASCRESEEDASAEVSDQLVFEPDHQEPLPASADTLETTGPDKAKADIIAPDESKEHIPRPAKAKKPASTKRRSRKPQVILEAEEAVAVAKQEVEELNRSIAAAKETLLADGLDPDVKRRGRRPARLVEYAAMLEAEIEARRKQQAAEYNLAKLKYELT